MTHSLRIITLVLALGGTYAASGQGYPMFLWSKGTEWFQYSSGAPLYYCGQGHEVGDTIRHQGKLLFQICAYEYGTCRDTTSFSYFIYHDTLARRMYQLQTPEDTMQLLYDFNLQVGDTLKAENFPVLLDSVGYPIIVLGIDSLSVSGKSVRRFRLSTYPNEIHLIEGVGSDIGYGMGLRIPPEGGGSALSCFSSLSLSADGITPVGVCFEEKSPCDFFVGIEDEIRTSNIRLSPNPASDRLLVINMPMPYFTYEILDQLGRVCRQGTSAPGEGLSLTGLNKGLYYLKTAYGTWRFVKE